MAIWQFRALLLCVPGYHFARGPRSFSLYKGTVPEEKIKGKSVLPLVHLQTHTQEACLLSLFARGRHGTSELGSWSGLLP